MPTHRLDLLARWLVAGSSRRQALGAGVVAALGLTIPGLPVADANAGAKKKAKCVALGAKCTSKKKCCKGTICTDKACACPSGKRRCGKSCVNTPCCSGQKLCDGNCIPVAQCCPSDGCGNICQGAIDGTACGDRGIRWCIDGQCQNRSCTVDGDCPALTPYTNRGEFCFQPACQDTVCIVGKITDNRHLPAIYQTANDCNAHICSPNISNGLAVAFDPNDHLPDTDCISYTCTSEGREPDETVTPQGTACTVGGQSGMCDGAGTCVVS